MRRAVLLVLAAGSVVQFGAAFAVSLFDRVAPGGIVALALCAGVCWATYIVLSVRVGRDWPGASGLAVALVFGALLTAPAGIVQGGSDLLQLGVLAAGLVVALASSVIPYSLEMEALR